MKQIRELGVTQFFLAYKKEKVLICFGFLFTLMDYFKRTHDLFS